jgi:hypothetical protein
VRAVGGAAAVAAVAVGSVTLSGAFGSDTGSGVGPGSGTNAVGPNPLASTHPPVVLPPPSSWPGSDRSSSASGPKVPSTWTVRPATKVTDPEYVTPRAIVAEVQKLLPAGTATAGFSGAYAYGGGDPRDMWAVIGELDATTTKGKAHLEVTVHKGSAILPQGSGCGTGCTVTTTADGSEVELRHGSPDGDPKRASVYVIRPGGMSVQVSVGDAATVSDDELFTLASNGDWGDLKMEKAFVQQAENTIHGDFMNPPA